MYFSLARNIYWFFTFRTRFSNFMNSTSVMFGLFISSVDYKFKHGMRFLLPRDLDQIFIFMFVYNFVKNYNWLGLAPP